MVNMSILSQSSSIKYYQFITNRAMVLFQKQINVKKWAPALCLLAKIAGHLGDHETPSIAFWCFLSETPGSLECSSAAAWRLKDKGGKILLMDDIFLIIYAC